MAIDYVIAGILAALSIVIWLMGGGQMLLLLFPVLLLVAVLTLMNRERWQRLGWGWVVVPLLGLGLLFLALVWVHLWRCGAPWSCPGEVAAGVEPRHRRRRTTVPARLTWARESLSFCSAWACST